MTVETKTRTYRASNAPLHAACPASAHGEDDAVAINRIDEAGTIGTAVHEAAACIARGESADTGRIALKHSLEDAGKRDLVIMTSIATQFWAEYGGQFQPPRCVESEWTATDGIPISGHVDVAGLDNNGIVSALDWKTTRLEAVNYRPQMMAYLWLAAQSPQSPYKGEGYHYTIVYLRDKTLETSDVLTPEQLQEWHDEHVERILSWDNRTYNPGGQCHYCPRYACCPGRREMVRSEFSALCSGDGTHRSIHELSSEQCVTTYERVKTMRGFLAEAHDALVARCEAEGGKLQGDGRALMMKERTTKKILAQPAWPILLEHLRQDELAPCVTIGKGKLEDTVAKKAGRGHGAKAKRALLAQLEEAGAVEESVTRYPAIVRALPVTESEIPELEDNDHDC